MEFTNRRGLVSLITFVYATNEERERKELWEDLLTLAGSTKERKWLVCGDFNEV